MQYRILTKTLGKKCLKAHQDFSVRYVHLFLSTYYFWLLHYLLCTYWLSGRAGRENIWLQVRTYRPSAARSVRPDREPNIFCSAWPNQSIGILSMTTVFTQILFSYHGYWHIWQSVPRAFWKAKWEPVNLKGNPRSAFQLHGMHTKCSTSVKNVEITTKSCSFSLILRRF